MAYPLEDLRRCHPDHLADMVVWFEREKERLERHVDAAWLRLPEDPHAARRELSAARWGGSEVSPC